MKIKIKSFNGELPDYLTDGKEYHVFSRGSFGVVTCCGDDGFFFHASTQAPSDRLNGGSWEVVAE